MADITYPAGCRPINEDLGQDELIRRLKTLTHTLQAMGQDEGMYTQYIPLAVHLADEFFLQHPSRDVQLLIACCIADVLRVYAPEAPYKDQEQIKGIFMFLIRQLNGLRDPKDPAFKRYFYLLENLAYVKSFNMCFELEDCQEVFCTLFSLMFKIVNDEHSPKVKSFMLDVLAPLITESDSVSYDLLDLLYINIVEPLKTQKRNAYELAKELIAKTSDTLESYTQAFFNQILILDKFDKQYQVMPKIYDVIYELNVIAPSILLSVLPQLECKLKSSHESERLKAVSMLARMFSERGSTVAKQYGPLWRQFLGRFYDIAVPIRIKCVQSTMHFLLNHPHLRRDIIDILRNRQHDSDETVRYEVVMAIVETAKRDFQIVSESEDLLEFVKERTLDKKYKIRKEAMNGLAMIYKKYLSDKNVPEATKKAVNWIKDKILHGYYMTGVEDRLLVERLLITCLVPYQLPAEIRMKKLYQLLGTIDDNATKAFIELQKNQLKVRRSVADWIKLHRLKELTPTLQKELNVKCSNIAKQLPDPIKAQEFLLKFSAQMRKDPKLIAEMETILKRDVSCRECADTMAIVLKKLGQPILTNTYYNTVKMLLERIASVMVDKQSIGVLIELIQECMNGGQEVCDEVSLPTDTAGERGLKLLTVLAYVFSAHFQHDEILRHMIGLLNFDEPYVAPYVLKAFTYLGRYKALIESHPAVLRELAPLCREFAIAGTPKQAKHAIRCMFVNTQPVGVTGGGSDRGGAAAEGATGSSAADLTGIDIFPEIVESLKVTLHPQSEHYRTAIVTLGHIAYNLPEKFHVQIKNIISRKIVKELLVKETADGRAGVPSKEWCDEDELPEETRCKVEGLKTMARWLLGLKKDVVSAQKTFRMLNAFISKKGDLLEQGGALSAAEKSWLRLSAGKAMLKICEQKGVGDQFIADQFYNLSQLMTDPVPEVRDTFVKKLHKGLNKGVPHKCLPLDFMGYYALGGRETERSLLQQIKSNIETDVNRRREYVKTFATVERAMSQLPHILPDYMLVFAVSVLTHDPQFTRPSDPAQLRQIERCLWLVLEPLVTNKEFFCFGFYKNLIERMKNHKDALKPDDETTNHKLWAICDIAMGLLLTRLSSYDVRESPVEARIPSMYFQPQPEDFHNDRYYIPDDMFALTKGGGSVPTVSSATNAMSKSSSSAATVGGTSTILTLKQGSSGRMGRRISNHQEEHSDHTDNGADDKNGGTSRRRRLGTAAPSTRRGQDHDDDDSGDGGTRDEEEDEEEQNKDADRDHGEEAEEDEDSGPPPPKRAHK
ncbi:androgen induced inhibitor of proliferation (as3) / pds5 [Anopheles darlingi]|uniref:Androgen induced inhibitor of proliferation (As3) / pds5 n=1 Tax=Anopheles darlingi TaxID=43151 RepID=W5JJM4_ANODA|nr:androgen induced inhibitor of proliferation (as3) / pds5 [Anopheles darlingi]